WHETHIRRFNRAHVGVAVAVEDGLITPVIRDADTKGIAEIAVEVKELAGRARERKLTPDEYTGATFSISNLGMFGIDEFTAIINPPEAGILAVGRAEEKVVVEDGELVVRPRMRITMSCDHRVIDGATGARFLQTLRAMIEEPMMMRAKRRSTCCRTAEPTCAGSLRRIRRSCTTALAVQTARSRRSSSVLPPYLLHELHPEHVVEHVQQLARARRLIDVR